MDHGNTSRANYSGHFHESRVRGIQPPTISRHAGAAMTTTGSNKSNGKLQHDYSQVSGRAELAGRNVLGALLEEPELWSQAATLKADYFLLKDQREIFRTIEKLRSQGLPSDLCAVAAELASTVKVDYLASLRDGVMPEYFQGYIEQLRQANQERQFLRLRDELDQATVHDDRARLVEQMQEVLKPTEQEGKSIFHSIEEFENAPPLRFAINNFLLEDGITMIGGLSCHGKTLVMLSMAQALLDGRPLFGYEPFAVTKPAERVLYLIPECSIGPFWSRLQLFRLQEHVRSGRLLVRTLSSPEDISLDDPRLLQAAKGADVFLDTAVRFMDGSDSDIEDTRPFAATLFRLLRSGGRTVNGAHHSAKAFENAEVMTLGNVLRGSGDIGCMLSGCWGVRQIDADNNQIYVEDLKPRDSHPFPPFVLEGRPHLDETGQFKMLTPPGQADTLRSYLRKQKGEDDDDRRGRPVTANKDDKLRQAVELRTQGLSVRDIAKTLGAGKSTVDRWLFQHDSSQSPSLPIEGVP